MSKSSVKSTCWDTRAMDSIIKSGQKDTEASIHDIISCQIAFLNKTLESMSVYTKPEKQPTDTISCQNNFHIYCFLGLFVKQSIKLICIQAILLSKRGLGALHVGSRCLHVKQNGTDSIGSIFAPPVDAEQSCTGLLRQRVSDSCRAV